MTRRCSASATRSSSSSAAPATSRPATAPKLAYVTEATAPVGGTVPATLALTLGAPATFGAFTPGVAKDYTATTTANVISTAGDAALTRLRPRPPDQRHVRAAVSRCRSRSRRRSGPRPVSNDAVTITFRQHIGATDPLRTGAYSKTLTFTLSTTTP